MMIPRLLVWLLTLAMVNAGGETCTVPAGRPSCVCDTGAGGIIDLTTIAGDGAPKFAHIKDSRPGEYFTYSYNPCFGFTDGGRCENVAACQLTSNDKYGLGTIDTELMIYDGQSAYLEYSNGAEGRSTHVSLVCDMNRKEPLLEANGDSATMFYDFTLHTMCACPGACGPAAIGVAPGVAGIVVMLLALASVIVYFITGSLIMTVHYKKTGLDVIPNKEFWRDMPFLVKDGVLFVCRLFTTALKRNSYQQID